MENLPLRGFEATCCACVSFTWEIVRDSLIINVVSLTTDTGALPRMFADDTNLTLSAKTLTELKLALTPELNNLSCWLKANKLSLNVAKTELMIIGSRQRLSAQCDDVEIRIDDQIIKRVDHTKSLGLTIDAQLSWGKHVEEICKKVSSAIGALKRVRLFISKETAIQIYNAFLITATPSGPF